MVLTTTRDYEPKPLTPDDRSILFYGFESVKGALVMDTSGNGNHAQLFGAWRFTVAGGLPIGGAVYVKNPDQERIRL